MPFRVDGTQSELQLSPHLGFPIFQFPRIENVERRRMATTSAPTMKQEPSIVKIEPGGGRQSAVSGVQRRGRFMIAAETCNLMFDIVSEKALHKTPSFKYVLDRALDVHNLKLNTSIRPVVVRSIHQNVQVEYDKKYRLIRYNVLGDATQEEHALVALYNACADGLGVRWTHAHAFRFLCRLQLRQKFETSPMELLEMLANHLPQGKHFKLWEFEGDSQKEFLIEGKQLNQMIRGVKRKGSIDSSDRGLIEAQHNELMQHNASLRYILMKDEHSRCHEFAQKYGTDEASYTTLYKERLALVTSGEKPIVSICTCIRVASLFPSRACNMQDTMLLPNVRANNV